MPRLRFVLASASPARRSVLKAAGVDPIVMVSGVDESGVTGTAPHVAGELAQRKARAVAAQIQHGNAIAAGVEPTADAVVLGCDSVLEFDGEVLGKPADATDARNRWRRMRGKSGILHTGHHLVRGAQEAGAVASTLVRFAEISDVEIDAYVATGEPLRVAGAFTIDSLGGWFIAGIDGDPGTVIGLSLPLLRTLVTEVGLSVPDLWASPQTPY